MGRPSRRPPTAAAAIAERRREPGAPALLHDEDRHRVGADGHEPDLPEVEQAREAELHLKPEREDRVDARDDADERPEAAAREDAHAIRACPKNPCGRTSSATISTTERDDRLVDRVDPARESRPGRDLLRDAERESARERAVRAADAAEHDRGEHGQQQLEAEVRVERVLDERRQDAGEPGEQRPR